MCKPLTHTGPTVPEFVLAVIRPVVACAACGGVVVADGDEVFCIDCPIPFVVPAAATEGTR